VANGFAAQSLADSITCCPDLTALRAEIERHSA
jgi:hypothetical protein